MIREQINISEKAITLSDVHLVDRGAEVKLGGTAREKVRLGRKKIEDHLKDDRPVYGVNTGFGRLAGKVVSEENLSRLQRNLLLSHACATGTALGQDVVRVMIFLRVVSLAIGRSGIREETLDYLLAFLNNDILPVVPSQGSLGASGDLAPLAHLVLPLIGEGECRYDGKTVTGKEALEILGLQPLKLEPKEGLALINGTQAMTAICSLAFLEAERIADAADVASGMSVEVLLGTKAAFDLELIGLRPHPGAIRVAGNLLALTMGSEIFESHTSCSSVQDAYSLRCVPQVHGATRDALKYIEGVLSLELRSVTDNPLLMSDGRILSGGNFHGQPVALAADHLALAVSELGNISERRIERLLNPDLNGLPAFLSPHAGLNSGLMIAQYTAASLVSENKVLVHPSSADSISVSGSQEDHVSMGTTAARHAAMVVENVRKVIAIELISAAQAFEFLDRGGAGRGTGLAYRKIRERVTKLEEDRQLSGDIDIVAEMISEGVFSEILREICEGQGSYKPLS